MKKQLALILLASMNIISLNAAADNDLPLNNKDKIYWEKMVEEVNEVLQRHKPQYEELFKQIQAKSIDFDKFNTKYKSLRDFENLKKQFVRLSNHTNEPITIKDESFNKIIGTIQPRESKILKSSTGGYSIDLFANNNKIEWDRLQRGNGKHFHIEKDASNNFSVRAEDPFEDQ